MAAENEEERSLRSVALRNAQSIFLARRQAERELVGAKEALERKTEELAEQRERFRVTLSSIGDGVITTNTDAKITFLNATAEALTGWSSADASGQPLAKVFNIINEDSRQPVENLIGKVLREGTNVEPANHTALIAKGGDETSIEDSAAPIRDASGSIVGAVIVFHDVTERRKLEAVHSRLAAVVEYSDDAIVSKTLEGIITTWNKGAERIFGYTASEIIGQPVSILIPPNRAHEETKILERIGMGETILPFETVRIRKDGTLLSVSLTVSPIKDASGAVIGASKIARDITQRKRADAENARLYEELRHANAAKDHFMAVLSHELRTPLNPVLMTIADLESDETVPLIVREQLTVVRRNVELEARLIDDLLDSTGIANGKLQLHRRVVSATELVHRAIGIVESDARKKRVRLDTSVCLDPCPVDADPARLQQVIWNVVKNAVKFTPEGGWVRVRCEPASLDCIRVTVEDSGIGIEPEHLGKVFNAFEQGDGRTGHRFGGLGLGLAISKALVTLHGGSLTAQSEGRGRGATFIVELPMAAQPAAPITSGLARFAPRCLLHLLVVEDDQATSNVMTRLLTKRGYSVTLASSIKEALEVLQQSPVDILISDVGLPDGSGRDLMEKVRQTRSLPGIALSGYGTEADLAQSSHVGFSRHLTKPVDIDLLDREIQALAPEAAAAG